MNGLRVLVGTLCTLVMPCASMIQADESVEPAMSRGDTPEFADEIARLLLEVVSGDEYQSGYQLAALGAPAVPELFGVLRDEKFALPIGDDRHSVKPLTRSQRTALYKALRHLPKATVLAFLTEVAVPESVPDQRTTIAAQRILGEIGASADFGLMLRLGHPVEGRRRVAKPVRAAFTEAFERFLLRNPGEVKSIRSGFRRAHASFLAPMITTLGHEPGFERLRLLTELLEIEPGVDSLLLVEIGRMGAVLPHPLGEQTRAAVRAQLSSHEEQILIEASMAIAALEDTDAVKSLIALLDHPSRNVSSAALTSLRALGGRDFGIQSDRWLAWYRAELIWWEREAQLQFNSIRTGQGSEASRIILELSKKRLFRHQLTKPLASGLDRKENDLVVLTCATLGHLGSSTAIPLLVECLERPDQSVQSAAWRALRRITGLELGPDPELWRNPDLLSPRTQ